MIATALDLIPPVGKRTRYARMRVTGTGPGDYAGLIEVSWPGGHWRPAGARLARRLAKVLPPLTINGTKIVPIFPNPVPRRRKP